MNISDFILFFFLLQVFASDDSDGSDALPGNMLNLYMCMI